MPEADFLQNVARQTLYIVILGASNLILSYAFLCCWLVFGELQAKNARNRLYSCMLDKQMEWYDDRKPGISALLARIQRYVGTPYWIIH